MLPPIDATATAFLLAERRTMPLHVGGLQLVSPPIISNVPGPRETQHWNGARLDCTYPLSVPIDEMARNITCTSYDDKLALGLIGCRRQVPHPQRLLGLLDDEVRALEQAEGVTAVG